MKHSQQDVLQTKGVLQSAAERGPSVTLRAFQFTLNFLKTAHRFSPGREKNEIKAEAGTCLEKHRHLGTAATFCSPACAACRRLVIAFPSSEM